MTLQLWLADTLRAEGLTVIETAHWQTRQSRAGFTPQGLVLHDTVTPPGLTKTQEQDILINGRPDLSGPLAQLGLHRDGVISVIAAGRANHNGYGSWGNDAFGIEAFCYGAEAGHVEPYNEVQRAVVKRAASAICRHQGWSADKVKGHKETDPARKVDPFMVDMPALRADVTALLHPTFPKPPVNPVPTVGETLMRIFKSPAESSPGVNRHYLTNGPKGPWYEITAAHASHLASRGVPISDYTDLPGPWGELVADDGALGPAVALP